MSNNRRVNKRANKFLDSIPEIRIESETCDIAARSKFNFSYFDASQAAGQNFNDWTHVQLYKLLDKLKYYSKEPLSHWKRQRIGAGGGHVLEIYVDFPPRSEFKHPKAVPINACWGRFRLESDMRLVGFVIPDELDGKLDPAVKKCYCNNTFYVVFLDENHRFYKT